MFIFITFPSKDQKSDGPFQLDRKKSHGRIAPFPPPPSTKEWIANEFLDLKVLELEKRDWTPSFLDMAR